MLKDAVAKVVYTHIGDSGPHGLGWEIMRKGNHELLNSFKDQGVIDNAGLEKAIESMVFREATTDYTNHVGGNYLFRYPDHFLHPEFFAYALQKGIFSRSELKKIRFDHGETIESYCQKYGRENLLGELTEELFVKPEPLSAIMSSGSDGDWDPHWVCDCIDH
jgi:hypothetical protein